MALLGVVVAAARGLRREYDATHRRWREAPLSRLNCADAALTGVGVGLAAATAIFLAAALVVRLTPLTDRARLWVCSSAAPVIVGVPGADGLRRLTGDAQSTRVMARPMTGSAMSSPSATTAPEATNARLT